MSSAGDFIGARLAWWTRLVVSRPRLISFTTLGGAVVALWYAVGHLGINTDTANMIAATLPWRQDFNEYRDTFPVRDKNLIVVVDATTPVQADAFATALIGELKRRPDLYRAPLLAGEGEFFEQNGLLYLSVPELNVLADKLAAAQPLLGLLRARFDGAAVLDVATQALTSTNGDDATLTPFYRALAESIDSAAEGRSTPLAWSNLLAPGSPSTRRLIVLQPALDFSKLQAAAPAIAGIREIAERLEASAASPVAVRLTGSVAMEHEEFLSVSRGAEIGALATFLMVAFVLYAALRSWRLLAISLVTLVAGLSLTTTFAAAAIGQLNLLSVAFVVLNVGLGSDYVIHVLLRYRELVAAGAATNEALVETMRGVGASLVLCAVTTAAGFYSFIPTTFSGVSELGLIAGTGVLLGLFVSVTLLPALVAWWGGARAGQAASTWIDPRWFASFSRRPIPVLAVTGAVLVGSLVLLPRVTFDSNPIHLRDPSSESVATLLELAANGEAPLLNLVAVAPNHATALAWAGELRGLPEVRGVATIDQLVPMAQDEKLIALEDLGLLLGPRFAELRRTAADPAAVNRALTEVANAAADVPAAATLRAAAQRLQQRLAASSAAERDAALRDLDESLTAGLPEPLRRLAAGLRAQAFGRGDLPEALATRWLAADGRELVEIVAAEDVSDNAAAGRFIGAVKGVVPKATGLPVVYQEASATVVGAFARALLYAFVMVSAIIFLVLRRGRDTLLVLLPIALASVVTAALTIAIDMPFNYANIIALPLLVGIGVDNGIHVVHRMRTESTSELFATSTMRAVLASGLTTVASFGNLAFSAHVGTASMGILLVLGLAASMAATLIVLPAWLKVTTRSPQAAA